MASKLFRTIVGIGISLGAASANACGSTDLGAESPDAGPSDGAGPHVDAKHDAGVHVVKPEAGTSDAGSDVSTWEHDGSTENDAGADVVGSEDAALDASVVGDAQADAPNDVGADAFCDFAWPTTKGSVWPPESCYDPDGACAAAGLYPSPCYTVVDGGCSYPAFFPFCIDGKFQCPKETISTCN